MKITYTFIMKVLPALLAALCWTLPQLLRLLIFKDLTG